MDAQPIPQSEDNVSRMLARVQAIIAEHQNSPLRLIPILHSIQREYRYLPEAALSGVASGLGLPPSHVFGVASFYSHFALKPKGKHVVKVCDGTACHVRGAGAIVDALRGLLSLGEAQKTTEDQLFTVETVSCVGACGLAPVLLVDDRVHGQATPNCACEQIRNILVREQGS